MIEPDGFVVVPEVLDRATVAQARDALEEVWRSEDDVAEDRGWDNDVYRVAYLLPAKHPFFVELCCHPGLVALGDRVLGPDHVVAGCNGLSMTPGGGDQDLHTDQDDVVAGDPMYLHLVCALDDFTAETGATRVIPGSHRWVERADRPRPREDDAVTVTVSAGGVLAYDGRLWHAGSRNRTDRPRRAIHLFLGRSWVVPHWDFAGSFAPETTAALSPEARRRFGFSAAPPRFDLTDRRVVAPE